MTSLGDSLVASVVLDDPRHIEADDENFFEVNNPEEDVVTTRP